MNFNRVFIGGRLTKDAELKYLQSGTAVLEFSVATTNRIGDKEETFYLDFSMFGQRAEKLAQYLLKGKQVLVEGNLRMDKWEKDGNKYTKIYAIVESLEFA